MVDYLIYIGLYTYHIINSPHKKSHGDIGEIRQKWSSNEMG